MMCPSFVKTEFKALDDLDKFSCVTYPYPKWWVAHFPFSICERFNVNLVYNKFHSIFMPPPILYQSQFSRGCYTTRQGRPTLIKDPPPKRLNLFAKKNL